MVQNRLAWAASVSSTIKLPERDTSENIHKCFLKCPNKCQKGQSFFSLNGCIYKKTLPFTKMTYSTTFLFIVFHCFCLDGERSHPPLKGASMVSGWSACCTHHSSQAVLFHQLQRVLVAWCEVVVLSGADMISGHGAHGVDDVCKHTQMPPQLCAACFDHG